MKALTLLVDMDEIVVELLPAWYARHRERTGELLTVKKTTMWDVDRLSVHGTKIFEPLSELGFFDNLPAIPGAVSGLMELARAGHRIVIVTAAPTPEAMAGKARWVQRELPCVDKKDFVIAGSKSLVQGDVLFDDCPKNLIEYRNAWPYAYIATIMYPYGTHCAVQEARAHIMGTWLNKTRAWKQFVKVVKYLGEQNE